MRRVAVPLVALGLLVGATVPAAAAGSAAGSDSPGEAQAAKKKKKKKAKKKKKKKKKPAAPATPAPPKPPPPPPPPPQQTTFDKIDAAIASGAITPEQGLTYKVFASFGDPRLPGQFAGPADPLAHPPLDEVAAQWDQLSAGAQVTLGPFLVPPMHEGSYVNQQIDGRSGSSAAATPRVDPPNPTQPWCTGNNEINFDNWQFIDALNGPAAGKVRIWIQNRYASTDGAIADSLMAAMRNQIWPKLTTLMGRDPMPDGGSTGGCAGGTDALDIALVDMSPASTVSTTTSQESTSARILFPRASDTTAPHLTHEFMHAIQFSFNLAEGTLSSAGNAWIKDGTAQWAMDYVSSPTYGIGLTPNETEKRHGALSYYFTKPDDPVDTATPTGRPYGAYIFWFWAIRKSNDTSLVQQLWNAVGTQKSLEAAKGLFGAGWNQAWKDFTRTNWNDDGINDYRNWDSVLNVPAQERTINPLPNAVTPVITTVKPVAAKYWTFLPGAGVNELRFRNLGGVAETAGVQAIIKYKDGTFGAEDWTGDTQKDVPMCDKEKLTLVLSNSSITPNDTRAFNLSWSPVPPGPRSGGPRAGVCLPDPTGTFSGNGTFTDATMTLNYTWSGTADFEHFGPSNPWFPEFATEVWDAATVADGSVTLSGSGTAQGSNGECTVTIPADTYDLDGGTVAIQPGAEPHYGIDIQFPANEFPEATISCPDEDPNTVPFVAPREMVYTQNAQQTMVRGTYQGSATFGGSSFNWNFTDPDL
jgi:hypothetical protein